MVTRAFSIGHGPEYDRVLARQTLVKVGRKGGRHGSAVWACAGEAEHFLGRTGAAAGPWRVYEVELPGTWTESTYRVLDEPFSRLRFAARVVGRVS
jgi:hypothetical protein